jgi:hypothetical protein
MNRGQLEAAYLQAEARYRSLVVRSVALQKSHATHRLPAETIIDTDVERISALREWNRVFALLQASGIRGDDG